MEYTHKDNDYPKEIKLSNSRIEEILRKPKGEFTLDEAAWLLRLDADEMRRNCNALILKEIGCQWGKSLEELRHNKNVNPFVIYNCR